MCLKCTKLVFYTINKGESPSPPWDYLPEVLFIFNSVLVVSGHETTVISGHFTCGAGFLWPIFPAENEHRAHNLSLESRVVCSSTWTWQKITSEKYVAVFIYKDHLRKCLVGKITPWKLLTITIELLKLLKRYWKDNWQKYWRQKLSAVWLAEHLLPGSRPPLISSHLRIIISLILIGRALAAPPTPPL